MPAHCHACSWVEERIAAVTMLPRENGEAFNVLQYQHLQHYDSHMDSFDPKVRSYTAG
jgi:prolyl 4-hydroxylase